MLTYHPSRGTPSAGPSGGTVWVDLSQPTDEEIRRVETEFDVRVPSREQLDEIESSSRLRSQNNRLYLSTPVGAPHELIDVAPSPLGFVISPELLITVRYRELRSFTQAREAIGKEGGPSSSTAIFATLLEAMVDVDADVLEKVARELGDISRRVFRRGAAAARRGPRLNRRLRDVLAGLGDTGEHLSQLRESLMGLQRIIVFAKDADHPCLGPDIQARLKTILRDLSSLTDFEAHLSGKTQFLLDATLGFINTEQNDIFKVLTIVSVVGVPPTLIASMYGMNFHNMPELSWPWGYEYGLALIAASAVLPILWFKWRGWW
ncbi:MAG TPA: magnesium transporter CorA family protein [Steroidobacteraceae bacterium]|nr:magnesium transporter CorA family protein [Steroidobacteraceae bacterium]